MTETWIINITLKNVVYFGFKDTEARNEILWCFIQYRTDMKIFVNKVFNFKVNKSMHIIKILIARAKIKVYISCLWLRKHRKKRNFIVSISETRNVLRTLGPSVSSTYIWSILLDCLTIFMFLCIFPTYIFQGIWK